jgi:AraC family transcriptional regulator of adaptative response / DNA-3-methyladenine glycosylase II
MSVPATKQQAYTAARLARDARFDGQFYVAVKTTGIFCRPICPANLPLEKNVEYFELQQQAMQAGYRPCLRCRPDSAPGSNAWRGINTTTDRALRLLRQNPDQTIAEISERLGITERYLHKLVTQAIGISPKQYRVFSQVLFAKQLLHQSQLPIEQVAQASGFASSRRLQAQMKKLTALSPSQIRQRHKPFTSGKIQLRLAFRPPYNWPMVRAFLKARAIAPIESVCSTSYQRLFSCKGQQGSVKATFNEAANTFDVALALPDMSAMTHVINNLRRVLDLDADPAHIHSHLIATGLRPAKLTAGIRLPGVWSQFEAGCRAIVGQQISVTAAINQLQRLCDHLNQDRDVIDFPSPQQWYELDREQLKMPNARKQALHNFAEYFANTEASNYDEILALKGIGPWTVSYMQLRGDSEPDLFLDKDLIVARELTKHSLDCEQAAPWRSYLTFQLWQFAS